MLVALSDTHSRREPALTDTIRTAIENADLVTHTGDFTTKPSLDTFEQLAEQLVAVRGNRDRRELHDRLPEQATAEWNGLRFLLVHGHRHDDTSLSMLARQEEADVVLVGHSHRPVIDSLGNHTLVNPGSHADPRGNQAAYATFERADGGVTVSLNTPDGRAFETKRL